jgi:hypothetical protein
MKQYLTVLLMNISLISYSQIVQISDMKIKTAFN